MTTDWDEDDEPEETEEKKPDVPPTASLMITQAQKAALREKGYTESKSAR
jgi:hypothetical protein